MGDLRTKTSDNYLQTRDKQEEDSAIVLHFGGGNQWEPLRDDKGYESDSAACYFEKIQTSSPVCETRSGQRRPKDMSIPKSEQVPGHLIVVVQSRIGKFGVKIYETESVRSHIVSTEKVGAKLFVIEDPSKARPKIGKSGKWLNVQTMQDKRGFVNAELVVLAE